MPDLVGPDEIRAVAEAALELKRADGVEVLLIHEWSGLTRFAESAIHQSTAREETGLDVEPLDFVGVWMDWYGDAADAPATLNLYWTARVLGGSPRPDDDVSELRWFRPDELPAQDEVAFVNVAEVIELWRQQNP